MTSLSPPFSPPNEVGSRPRAFSALSNDSKRSRRSSGSGTKLDLTETSKDKKRLNTKADPSKALNEAQPGALNLPGRRGVARLRSFFPCLSESDNNGPGTAAVAIEEESTLNHLRNVQWRDAEGNVIRELP
jgi:hypothetical protein